MTRMDAYYQAGAMFRSFRSDSQPMATPRMVSDQNLPPTPQMLGVKVKGDEVRIPHDLVKIAGMFIGQSGLASFLLAFVHHQEAIARLLRWSTEEVKSSTETLLVELRNRFPGVDLLRIDDDFNLGVLVKPRAPVKPRPPAKPTRSKCR